MAVGAPRSQGQIDPRFQDYCRALRESALQAAATGWSTASPWQTPLAGSPFDVAALGSQLARSGLADLYTGKILNPDTPGTVGDAVAVKTQHAYLAGAELALRAQMSTLPRRLIQSRGRLNGHGSAVGIFSDAAGAQRHALDALQAGRVTNLYPGQ